MAKNILIFSDGTGQGGGLSVDERRSNVYKLYRATRCGPDTVVDPNLQLAFYDPGLGSRRAAGDRVNSWRRLYNVLSQATGLGLTRNIEDCYAAILRTWSPGDRIYLFGFSRGAYTVRCVAGVLGLCGVPTHMPDGTPLRRDQDSTQALARTAVRNIYRFGNGVSGDSLQEERLERARAFRVDHGSDLEGKPNAAPYLIGVWDTVAALGLPITGPALFVAVTLVALAFVAVIAGSLSFCFSLLPNDWDWRPGFSATFGGTLFVVIASLLGAWMVNYVYWPMQSKERSRGFRVASHLRVKFYDNVLGKHVSYARHALSIDEARKDFARVTWAYEIGSGWQAERLEQIWFAGNHSDVGGSYDENESRLSDISLQWMVDEALGLPNPILVDRSFLHLFPSAAGRQHDEARAGLSGIPRFLRGLLKWKVQERRIQPKARLHPSVIERFGLIRVPTHDVDRPYRPESLRHHEDVRHFYDSKSE